MPDDSFYAELFFLLAQLTLVLARAMIATNQKRLDLPNIINLDGSKKLC